MSKKNTPAVSGPSGGLPGSGRTPKALQFKNYPKIIQLLDDGAEDAIKVLTDGLHATMKVHREEKKDGVVVKSWYEDVPDKWYRFNCAVQILKKILPDKKIKELTGPDGGPIETNINITNRRESVLAVVDILDKWTLDELQQGVEDGDFNLFRNAEGRTIEAETVVEAKTKRQKTRQRIKKESD